MCKTIFYDGNSLPKSTLVIEKTGSIEREFKFLYEVAFMQVQNLAFSCWPVQVFDLTSHVGPGFGCCSTAANS